MAVTQRIDVTANDSDPGGTLDQSSVVVSLPVAGGSAEADRGPGATRRGLQRGSGDGERTAA